MEFNRLVNQLNASSQKKKCDLVIRNVNVVDVLNGDIYPCTVGIKEGYIVGLGDYEGIIEIDGKGKFLSPSLIDSHVHIESSLVTPVEYSKAASIHGIGAVICDPHEIGNVLGSDGINLILELSHNLPVDFKFMLPSCVPATSLVTSGATLKSKDLEPFYESKDVLGLAEVMDYGAIEGTETDMLKKILKARNRNLTIDGHGAGLSFKGSNVCATAKITTDHECINAKEAVDRVRKGYYVLIREGSAAKNFNELIKAVNQNNSRRFCFCTDDMHIDELLEQGSIDRSIRNAIKKGIDPITAIRIASLNAAECYGLKDRGAVAPGYIADLILLDSLENFEINSVIKNGDIIFRDGVFMADIKTNESIKTPNSVRLGEISEDSFKIDTSSGDNLNIIGIIPNKLETELININKHELGLKDKFEYGPNGEINKLAVIERHGVSGNIGLALVKGFSLKTGAIGTTIAHDSHNIVILGNNDKDMLLCARELEWLGGGIVIVNNGKVTAEVQLEVGGLITGRTIKEVVEDMSKVHTEADLILGCHDFNPFLTLSFLTLPVIPDVKLTDKGIFDVRKGVLLPNSY